MADDNPNDGKQTEEILEIGAESKYPHIYKVL
jgi:hypothetical protein